MAGKNQTLDIDEHEEATLAEDPRWALVRRIVISEHLRRADQLRNILLYITRNAILKPHRPLREADIATEVLGRKPDFDPASDNIVRAQFSHLRRRLETYFGEEGRSESLVVTIPKGGYSATFSDAAKTPPLEPAQIYEVAAVAERQAALPAIKEEAAAAPRRRLNWRGIAAAFGVAALLLGEFLWLTHRQPGKAKDVRVGNAFVQLLARSQGEVTIVAPDMGLVMINEAIPTDISIADYVGRQYPQRQLAMVKDAKVEELLEDFNASRTTTLWEAGIAFDFKEVLGRAGLPAVVRYARDMHVGDFSQGNSILIGGPGSDPWASLFTDRLNFHFVERRVDRMYYFENERPAPDEQARYYIVYPWKEQATALGYVDVAFTQNASRTGYILLIVGADAQAAEAAARFLLHGALPPEIVSLLERTDLEYFEILLRGRHLGQEADDSFDLVTVRPR